MFLRLDLTEDLTRADCMMFDYGVGKLMGKKEKEEKQN